jgi:hypothetical protein
MFDNLFDDASTSEIIEFMLSTVVLITDDLTVEDAANGI